MIQDPKVEKRIVAFATQKTINLLEQPTDWLCSANFATAPNISYQVYTIYASVDGVNSPLVYALLHDKKKGCIA